MRKEGNTQEREDYVVIGNLRTEEFFNLKMDYFLNILIH